MFLRGWEMLYIDRRNKIIEILNEKKECSSEYLKGLFNVSISTIYRDLDFLESEGLVKKIHGGILLNSDEKKINKFYNRISKNTEIKKRMANKALEYIKNDYCIFLDNSTSCYFLAESLSKSDKKDILIVTNSLDIPGLFLNKRGIKIVSTGGIMDPDFSCFVGPTAEYCVNYYNADIFFTSASAISIEGELTDPIFLDSYSLKRSMMNKSKKTICLIDSSKFGYRAHIKAFSFIDIDIIITDYKDDELLNNKLTELNVELVFV